MTEKEKEIKRIEINIQYLKLSSADLMCFDSHRKRNETEIKYLEMRKNTLLGIPPSFLY